MGTNDPAHDESENDTRDQEVGCDEEDVGLINEPSTKDEILRAIRSLKNGKAPGPDRIIGEIFLNASDIVLGFFLIIKHFKNIFDKGIYPENWTDSFIQPLHKKEIQTIQITTEAFHSQILVENDIVLLSIVDYKCGLT